MPTINNRLGEILEKRCTTASELADKCNVTRATISNIINGHFNPSLILAIRISYALNMSVNDIFILEEDSE